MSSRAPAVPVVGFDLDMTLVDTREGVADTLQVVLGEVDVEVSAEQTWPYAGLPLEMIFGRLVPDLDDGRVADLVIRYRELYPSLGVPSARSLPGAAAALAAPVQHGGRSVVVSAKHAPAVHRVLACAGLDGAVAPGDVTGDLFAEAKGVRLAELGATAYVGDHPGDVRAARVAGAVAVGVATGAHDAAALRRAGADVVLESLAAFPGWLAGHAADLTG